MLGISLYEVEEKYGKVLVLDMSDGGMGSIEFVAGNDDEKLFGGVVVKADFKDSDGVDVMLAVNIDQRGRIWGDGFLESRLLSFEKYPEVDDLQNIQRDV